MAPNHRYPTAEARRQARSRLEQQTPTLGPFSARGIDLVPAGRWVTPDRASVLSISILRALTATVAAAKVT